MKSKKDHRQSFRLTRNGFRVRPNGRLFVAKVGEVRVRWSRDLPAEPSSVTIIREPDGHYYASFVVDVASRRRCRRWQREAGVDVGIARLATIADHRRDAHRHCEPETLGPQAAQAAAVGAGEIPPAERISQQGQDAAQGRHRAQRGGPGSAGLSPQAGFGVGSREPSDPRRGPQHRGHGREIAGWHERSAMRGGGSSCGSSARKPTDTGAPCTRCRAGWRRARRARPAAIVSTNCRCRSAHGRARRAVRSTTATTTPPRSFSPPGGRRD